MDKRKRPSQTRGDEGLGSKSVKTDTCKTAEKTELREMYGQNKPSPKKHLVAEGLKMGKNFQQLADELKVAQATAEVYGIDCLAAGLDMDHQTMAKYLAISVESFERIKGEIMSSNDRRLRTVLDNLEEFSYNQIRFVLACQIQDLDL